MDKEPAVNQEELKDDSNVTNLFNHFFTDVKMSDLYADEE